MIPLYLEKWSAIALQAKDINHDKAANSVRQAYHFLHLPEPPICYSSQPNQALSIFLQHKFIRVILYAGEIVSNVESGFAMPVNLIFALQS